MSANNSHNQIESSSSSDSDDFNNAQTWEDFTISPLTSPESRQQSLVELQRVDQYSSSSEEASRTSGRSMRSIREKVKRLGTSIKRSNSSDSSGSSPTIKRRKSIAKQGSFSQTQLGTTEDMPVSYIVPTVYANPRPGTSSSSEEATRPFGKRRRSIMENVKRIGTLIQESNSSDSSVRSPIIKRRKSIAKQSSFSQTAVEQSSTDSSDNEIGLSQTQYIPTLFPAIHGLPTVPTGQQFVPVHEDNIQVVNLASDDEDDSPICRNERPLTPDLDEDYLITPEIVNRLVFDTSSDE